jgi:hypothetical protein
MPAAVNVYGGDGELCVPDVLPGQVARRAEYQLGDVGRLADQAADSTVDVREVREVPELVEGGELRRGAWDPPPRTPGSPGTVAMPLRQLEHGRHRRRTDQVKVKFYLRQPVDERIDGLHDPDGSNSQRHHSMYLTQECQECCRTRRPHSPFSSPPTSPGL